MKIKLNNWKVEELQLSTSIVDDREDNNFNMSMGNFFPEEDTHVFGVVFNIELQDKAFDLSIKAVFLFYIDEMITEEFKVSGFPKINAPAIAFPYLRAYISNLTLQSGFEPVMLPSINFVELSKQNNQNSYPSNSNQQAQ